MTIAAIAAVARLRVIADLLTWRAAVTLWCGDYLHGVTPVLVVAVLPEQQFVWMSVRSRALFLFRAILLRGLGSVAFALEEFSRPISCRESGNREERFARIARALDIAADSSFHSENGKGSEAAEANCAGLTGHYATAAYRWHYPACLKAEQA